MAREALPAIWSNAVTVFRPSPVCRGACIALAVLIAGCGDAPSAPATEQAREQPQPARPAPQAQAATTAPATTPAARRPQDAFWSRMQALCGNAYAGFLTVGTEESDREFGEADLVIHVRDCDATSMHMPFHVSDDRSRTFVLRRDAGNLTLHHRHLDRDGAPAAPDGYGGRSIDDGSASRQEFPADEATQAALPASATNVWALEIEPGNYLAYELKRVVDERYFRVEFSLDEPVATPPPAWGHPSP